MDPAVFINPAIFGGMYAIFQQIQARIINLYSNFYQLVHWFDDSLPTDSGIPGALEASVLVPLFAWGVSMFPAVSYAAPMFPSIAMIPGSVLLGVAAFAAHIGLPGYWYLFNTFGKSTAEFIKDFGASFLPALLAMFL